MFDTQFETAQQKTKEQNQVVKSVTNDLIDITNKIAQGVAIDIDLDNARLDQVKETQDVINENIVSAIIGLNEISGRFGSEFNAMRTKTVFESVVSVFSKNQADEMVSRRVKSANIDSNLQDFLSQSDRIVNILSDSERTLRTQITKGNDNLDKTVKLREEVVINHKNTLDKVNSLLDKVTLLEDEIANNVNDLEKRSTMAIQLVELNKEYNEAEREKRVLFSRSQTLENYVHKNERHLESLNKSLAAQIILIDKIKTDTAQRVVLYDQYLNTLKISQEQQVGHQLEKVGQELDNGVSEGMAQAGQAAENEIVNMLESYNQNAVFNSKLSQKSKAATDRAFNRLKEQMKKHESGIYE